MINAFIGWIISPGPLQGFFSLHVVCDVCPSVHIGRRRSYFDVATHTLWQPVPRLHSLLIHLRCRMPGLKVPKPALAVSARRLFFSRALYKCTAGSCALRLTLELEGEPLSLCDSCFFRSRTVRRRVVWNKYIFHEVCRRLDMRCSQFSACCRSRCEEWTV